MHLSDALHSGYTFIISISVSWESNPQPYTLLTQCSTTEPQEHVFCVGNMHKLIVTYIITSLNFHDNIQHQQSKDWCLWDFVMFLKEVTIYLIKNSVKYVILWNIITISNNCFLSEYLLKCNLFLWCADVFSASLLQSSVSHDLQKS